MPAYYKLLFNKYCCNEDGPTVQIQQTVIYKESYVTALALLSAGVCLCRILGFLLSAQKEVRTRKKITNASLFSISFIFVYVQTRRLRDNL